ncbi:MAG: hypothetical protein LBQ60_07900 [Bacteroidales bacterium]|nr:hypothetical protein [Bacteroidales bacterium]
MKKICFSRYLFLFILHFSFSILHSFSQDTTSIRISVDARIREDAVLLRWGATTPMAWQQTNRYGFRIERYTVLRDRQVLPQPEKNILAAEFKAQPVKDWEKIATDDDHAAIIAQALYGEEFEVTGGDVSGVARIINLSQQLEQRFAMSLYAADRNFEAACMAGWGWRDTEVKAGEKYLYRVIPLVPPDIMVIDTGYIYTGPDDYEPLPQPLDLAAVFGDHSVMLTWNYDMMNGVYNSYYVEKSTDGERFERLPGLPVSNLNNRSGKTAQRMFFSDSLSNNTQIYYYRIRGLDAFGETGPSSEAVSGKGQTLLVYVPHITRAVIDEQGVMELEWEFDERGNELISGFELNRSVQANNGFTVVQENILPVQRKTEFGDLLPVNYLTISAIPKSGLPTVSFPVLVQPLDTVPPAVPLSFTGDIDTTGVVTLKWAVNKEPDMLGYKVYRALRKGDELLPLSDVAHTDTVYRDTVNLYNLNAHVYYTVVAVDMRYNQSPATALLELAKPVLIPPSSPVITGYRVTEEGVLLEWVNSPDETVTEHRLYRQAKAGPDSSLVLLQRFTENTVQTYTDIQTEPGIRYRYTLTAATANGLESLPSPPLTASGNRESIQEITRFEASLDKKNKKIKLTWSDNLKEVKIYELYKSANGQLPTLWKTVSVPLKEQVDEDIRQGNYMYLLRAVYRNGKNSKSKSITVKW